MLCVGPVDASKTVFVNHTAVIVVTKGVYSGMGMIPKDCFGNVAIINEDLLSIEIHKVSKTRVCLFGLIALVGCIIALLTHKNWVLLNPFPKYY